MSDQIQEVCKALESVERSLRKVKALHVNSAETKESIRNFVRAYFERSRSGLLATVSGEQELAGLDGLMQDLLRYSQRRTSVDDYRRCLSASKRAISEIELRSLNSLGHSPLLTPFEPRQTRILESLRKINPAAADAYEQGLTDLKAGGRKSWRGTAVEFRESLRELLDLLAPDSEVTKQPGFKLEPETKGPTMRQKTVFILRARHPKDSQSKAFTDALAVVEDSIGKFVRSVYTQSSVRVHVASSQDEVRRIRDYVTLLLGELLEVKD
jgi:hypothetical protein